MNLLETLKKYEINGLLYHGKHKTLPLTIWNYTPKTQYECLWDDVTMMCRGLVVDENGNIVARPFKKFFNIEENRHKATDWFVIYEKLDGSLGILFFYNGKWQIASRGSFYSEQANKANEMFAKITAREKLVLDEDCTYMVEIIYPENRIVVDYGTEERLVWLATIDTKTGRDYTTTPFTDTAERFLYNDYKNIKHLNWKNKEGFVVLFSNGDRCKIKFDDYLRLHKIVTNTSSVHIWEMMKDGGDMSAILNNVPDEFYAWAKSVVSELELDFEQIAVSAIYHYEQMACPDRKEFAEKAKSARYPQLLFALYDGKDITDMVWRLIKPNKEKAFSI